jgi:hypothetical protein
VRNKTSNYPVNAISIKQFHSKTMYNMKKSTKFNAVLFGILLVASSSTFAQLKIGVNPNQIVTGAKLQIDGDNTTATPAKVIVTSTGSVGIGTAAPGNVLEVNGSGGTATGLKLPTGAGPNKVLTSDVNGNANWVAGKNTYKTMISGSGGPVSYSDGAHIAALTDVVTDEVPAVSSGFGWNNGTQTYTVPYSGSYRVNINGYFNGTPQLTNQRIYLYKNGSQFIDGGFPSVSIQPGTGDQQSFSSGIVVLTAGDILDFRAFSSVSGVAANIYLARGHTQIFIEAL